MIRCPGSLILVSAGKVAFAAFCNAVTYARSEIVSEMSRPSDWLFPVIGGLIGMAFVLWASSCIL